MVVESVGLVVGAETLSHSQLDVYRTVIVLLNLCQAVRFAGNFVFFVRLRRGGGGGGRGGTDVDRSAMALCRLRSADTGRSTHQTEPVCVTYCAPARSSINLTANNTWPETSRHVATTSTPASV